MISISIVVPVYNVKLYLERCIKSLLNQSFVDFEIILIDDGSSDGSENMCDEYTRIDSRVKVVHQINSGLSSARNTGVRNALGEYILFVDSDDYIAPETCEILYREAKERACDIVCADSYSASDDGLCIERKHKASISVPCEGKVFLAESVLSDAMIMCAPFALYKKSLIVDNDLWFKEGVLHEDELWTPQVYLKAGRVSYVSFVFYYHWQRAGSITHSKWSEKRTQDVVDTCEYLAELYRREYKNVKYKNAMLDYVCMLYLNALNLGGKINGDKRFLISTARRHKNIIKAIIYCISPRLYLFINPHRYEEL